MIRDLVESVVVNPSGKGERLNVKLNGWLETLTAGEKVLGFVRETV
jgi:hypothetical protein